MGTRIKSGTSDSLSETQLSALGLFFRAVVGGAANYKAQEIRYLHDVPSTVADFVRQVLQDEGADDLAAYSNEGDALVSLRQVDWSCPGIFGPTGRTFYLDVVDEEGGTFGDYLLSEEGSTIATWIGR